MLNWTPDGQRGERCHKSQGWEKVAKDRRGHGRILVLFCVTAAVTGTRDAKRFGVLSVTWRWWRNPRWHRLDYIGVSLFQRKSSVHQARRSPRGRCGQLQRHSSSITHTDLMHRRVSFKGNTSCCPGKDGLGYRTSMVNVKHIVYCRNLQHRTIHPAFLLPLATACTSCFCMQWLLTHGSRCFEHCSLSLRSRSCCKNVFKPF